MAKSKTAKKKTTRKRKASPAQLRALAKGRAAMQAKRKKTAAPKKKKTSSTRKSKIVVISNIPAQKESSTMAKKKSSGSSSTPAKKKTRKGGKYLSKAKGMIPMVKDVAIAVAGGVGGGVLANKLPIANPKIKAAFPLIAGLALAATLGKKKRIFHEIGTGMAVIGGLALLKQFAPNVPMLAGEDEVMYLDQPGYAGDMLQLGYDESDDYMGDMLQLGEDSEEYMSPASI